MKRWACLVAGLYVLALTVLAGPFIYASLAGEVSLSDAPDFYTHLPWALPFFAVLGLIQLALLAVRVPAAEGRPIKRGHVFWTIFACLTAIAILIVGSAAAVYETMQKTPDLSWGQQWPIPFGILAGIWLVWTFLFAFYAGHKPAEGLLAHLCRWLIAGSILELLIAVPTHIIARWRGYCCAGFLTVMGLAAGIAVMMLAFGPAVFALFLRRYASVKPNLPAVNGKQPQ